jgi:hypothetical protein
MELIKFEEIDFDYPTLKTDIYIKKDAIIGFGVRPLYSNTKGQHDNRYCYMVLTLGNADYYVTEDTYNQLRENILNT